MRLSSLLLSACTVSAALAASIPSRAASIASREEEEEWDGVAYVRGGDAAYYVLGITPPGQAKIIAYWPTGTAWFVRPIEFAISAGYACYFYKETPYGPGERIGEFQGPIQASFDDFFAAFYSCWRVVLDNPS
ncbi:hypothetical protein ACJQWK_05375 [Exserohilum turcicum]|uniref:Uncharacterized protein n=1 Tax=Exserohilum turcicum (strain 28A) TaxID=671987 RepID=R0I949_EXST2|nr:uncharacterized protein SETTUDRAFT_181218 [Exserohilum turcica Et28A]EOA81921.1 hypothetical protein SETTUDRAFT_181218 [Exserohilum turcica Et28A]